MIYTSQARGINGLKDSNNRKDQKDGLSILNRQEQQEGQRWTFNR
jgi:hypothetical protein